MRRKKELLFTTRYIETLTGITGLDEITGGGIPTGRPTLICGEAGCGKTLMSPIYC